MNDESIILRFDGNDDKFYFWRGPIIRYCIRCNSQLEGFKNYQGSRYGLVSHFTCSRCFGRVIMSDDDYSENGKIYYEYKADGQSCDDRWLVPDKGYGQFIIDYNEVYKTDLQDISGHDQIQNLIIKTRQQNKINQNNGTTTTVFLKDLIKLLQRYLGRDEMQIQNQSSSAKYKLPREAEIWLGLRSGV